MAAAGLDMLSSMVITRIMKGFVDARENQPSRLRFSSRLPKVNASPNEMFARFIGRVLIADMIARDSAAGVYSSGKMDFVSYDMPKLKIGRSLTESQLEQFNQIRTSASVGESMILDFLGPVVENCLVGIENRKEALAVAMMRDRLDYDRLGYKASGSLWGMPSDLKVTPAIPWTAASTATPVDDVLTVRLLGSQKYGVEFDRMTMSTTALRYAIATTEFATKAKLFFRADITIANTSLMNLEMQKRLFEDVTGMSVELSDQRYFYQTAAGAIEGTRYLPINEVIIDSSQNDGNSAVWDMAQGPVIETMLLGLNPAAVVGGGLPEARRGPIGYMTFPPDLNPPNVTVWGVDCAFPRRHMPAANAHMTVGSFTDMIPVADISF